MTKEVTTLTDQDLEKYKGVPSSMGDQTTVTAETPDMPERDDYEALDPSDSQEGDEEEPARSDDSGAAVSDQPASE